MMILTRSEPSNHSSNSNNDMIMLEEWFGKLVPAVTVVTLSPSLPPVVLPFSRAPRQPRLGLGFAELSHFRV